MVLLSNNVGGRVQQNIPGSDIGRHQGPTVTQKALETKVSGSLLESRASQMTPVLASNKIER